MEVWPSLHVINNKKKIQIHTNIFLLAQNVFSCNRYDVSDIILKVVILIYNSNDIIE